MHTCVHINSTLNRKDAERRDGLTQLRQLSRVAEKLKEAIMCTGYVPEDLDVDMENVVPFRDEQRERGQTDRMAEDRQKRRVMKAEHRRLVSAIADLLKHAPRFIDYEYRKCVPHFGSLVNAERLVVQSGRQAGKLCIQGALDLQLVREGACACDLACDDTH